MPTAPSAPTLSRFRRAGDLIFVSGQLPRDTAGALIGGDSVAQSRQALANLVAVLAEAGARPADVVKVTAWLTEPRHAAGFNLAYQEIFQAPYPARSVVISGLVADAAVEVEAVAFAPLASQP